MNGCLLTKLIFLQFPLASLDREAIFAWKDPFVAFLETDAAIAFRYIFQLGEFDGKFEGAAVTVSMIDFELLGSGVGHD